MKKLLVVSLVFLTSCVSAFNQVKENEGVTKVPSIASVSVPAFRVGQDTLAMQNKNWNQAAVNNNTGLGTPLGLLYDSFGEGLKNIDAALNEVKPFIFRIHLINGPGIRNGQSCPNEIGRGYSKVSFCTALRNDEPKIIQYIQNATSALRTLCEKYPETKCVISPILEHDCEAQSFRHAVDAVLDIWPAVQIVNSPDGGISVERYRGAWIERHGATPQADADITSFDGAEATDSDVQGFLSRASNAKVKYIWTRLYNCRKDAAPFQCPNLRTNCPNSLQVEEHVHIVDMPPNPTEKPKQCKYVVKFNPGWIWKPMAEHGPGIDTRADKPVAITKYGTPQIKVLAQNGVQVGALGYYGSYTPLNLKRHYSGWKGGSSSYGYQLEKKALAATGIRYIYLQSGTECAGPILTGRRNGRLR